MASLLREKGYDVHFLNFKLMLARPTSLKEYPAMKKKLREQYGYFIVQNFMRKKYFLPSDNAYTEKEVKLCTEHVKNINPDFICMSVQSANLHICRFLTTTIKEIFPEVQVVWGGIVPTYQPEESLGYADIACRGEGEYPLLELATAPTRTDIKNLWFRTSRDRIVRNAVRPQIENLDKLPFPQYGRDEMFIEDDRLADLFEESPQMRNDHVYIQTSRGCAYQCSYCHNSYLKKKVYPGASHFRQRSVDNVIKQIEFYREEYDLQHVLFTDEIFIKNESWIEEFARKYHHINLPFGGYCHPAMTNEKMLRMLQDIGMDQVAMGVQSGSERMLKEVYHRYFGVAPIKEMIKIFDRLQFNYVRYDLIVNNPFEHDEDYKKTLELLLSINHTFDLALFDLELFPFTELSEMEIPAFTLNPRERESWIILFLMTTIQGFPPSLLRKMAHSKFLKNHPELLRFIGFLFRNDDVLPPYFDSYEPYRVSWKTAIKNLYRYFFPRPS